MNAFMVWSQMRRREMENVSNIHHAQISKTLGAQWKTLTDEERKAYYSEAARLRVLHNAEYPNYKYKPRKKASCPLKTTNSASGRVNKRRSRKQIKITPTSIVHSTCCDSLMPNVKLEDDSIEQLVASPGSASSQCNFHVPDSPESSSSIADNCENSRTYSPTLHSINEHYPTFSNNKYLNFPHTSVSPCSPTPVSNSSLSTMSIFQTPPCSPPSLLEAATCHALNAPPCKFEIKKEAAPTFDAETSQVFNRDIVRHDINEKSLNMNQNILFLDDRVIKCDSNAVKQPELILPQTIHLPTSERIHYSTITALEPVETHSSSHDLFLFNPIDAIDMDSTPLLDNCHGDFSSNLSNVIPYNGTDRTSLNTISNYSHDCGTDDSWADSIDIGIIPNLSLDVDMLLRQANIDPHSEFGFGIDYSPGYNNICQTRQNDPVLASAVYEMSDRQ